jgi:endoglucanase
LILDLHAAPGGQGNDLNISDGDTTKPSLWASAANQQKTIALWQEIARRYANEPWIGGYDILNEPNFGFTNPLKDKNGTGEKVNAPLKKLLMDITQAIRAIDKKHMIIIEGNGWGNNYNGMLPTWDNNMVLSFHKYWNYNDQASIQSIINTRDKYNVPVWLGETGENSNVWFTQAIRLLETNNIGFAWWPLKKMGANNPLEIRSNLNYDALVNYWNGKGEKPKESNVYSALLELATYAKLESNIYHKDVIDAMMRQPFSAAAIPYKNNIITGNTLIKAVEYDLGRNGIAYYDTDTADYKVSGKPGAGNRGRTFRNDGVDINKDAALYESYYVSDIEKGEWLQFTIDVSKKGVYTLQVEVAADKPGGSISISSGTRSLANNIVVPVTGGLNKWQIVEIKNVVLPAGKQALKVFFVNGGFNLKSIRFVAVK